MRLARSLAFRRFLVTNSLLTMSGSSSIVKAGSSFGPLSLGGHTSCGMDEKTQSTIRIAASLSLGPLLFAEFCAHCYHLDRTSVTCPRKSSTGVTDLPLAQLSLRAFTSAVRGMTFDAQHHALSKAQRVQCLIMSSIGKASAAVPCSADGFQFYQDFENGSPCVDGGVDKCESQLGRGLLPLLSIPAENSNDPSTTRLCLFSELLSNCMYGESMECCYMMYSVSEAFTDPNLKEQLAVSLLRGFEKGGGDNTVGVLGLEHSDESNDNNACVSAAISVAMKLNAGLDGNTHVPVPGSEDLSGDRLRAARSKMGLPTTLVENWPERQQPRLRKESRRSTCDMIGIASQVAWAMLATL